MTSLPKARKNQNLTVEYSLSSSAKVRKEPNPVCNPIHTAAKIPSTIFPPPDKDSYFSFFEGRGVDYNRNTTGKNSMTVMKEKAGL